jgi:hypothetical protein
MKVAFYSGVDRIDRPRRGFELAKFLKHFGAHVR